MVATIFDHVINPKASFLGAGHRLISRDLRQLADVRSVRAIVDEFPDVVMELVGGELEQVETKCDTSVSGSTAVPTLFGKHGNSEHRNTVIN